MTKRKSLSKKLRFEIFKRDSFTCQYCGCHPPGIVLEIDHVIPVSEGGENDEENLVTSCFDCNRGKSNRSLASTPESIAARMEREKEIEAQVKAYTKLIRERKERVESEAWQVVSVFCEEHGDQEKFEAGELSINKDWFKSVKRFISLIGLMEALEAMEIAVEKFPWSETKCFKYFCGICWRKVKDANESMEGEDA